MFQPAKSNPTVIVSRLIIEEEECKPVLGDVDHGRRNTEEGFKKAKVNTVEKDVIVKDLRKVCNVVWRKEKVPDD